jgi:hypothetical protein
MSSYMRSGHVSSGNISFVQLISGSIRIYQVSQFRSV